MIERVVGVDPSLTSTGLATITRVRGMSTEHHTIPDRIFLTVGTLKPSGAQPTCAVQEAERVADLVDQVCRSSANADAVYIESLALASRTGKSAERAHLYFSLVAAFAARRVPITVLAPATLKRRIGCSGRADKERMISAVRHAWSSSGWSDGPAGGRSDRADAAALAWCGALDLGWSVPNPPSDVEILSAQDADASGSCAA